MAPSFIPASGKRAARRWPRPRRRRSTLRSARRAAKRGASAAAGRSTARPAARARGPGEGLGGPSFAHLAYVDEALPIASGQTISQPFIVALMSEALELTGSERVLEIGTGSGYQTAVLAELASEVVSVERLA